MTRNFYRVDLEFSATRMLTRDQFAVDYLRCIPSRWRHTGYRRWRWVSAGRSAARWRWTSAGSAGGSRRCRTLCRKYCTTHGRRRTGWTSAGKTGPLISTCTRTFTSFAIHIRIYYYYFLLLFFIIFFILPSVSRIPRVWKKLEWPLLQAVLKHKGIV